MIARDATPKERLNRGFIHNEGGGAVPEVLFYHRLYSPYFTEIGWHKTFVIQLGNQCTSVHDCFGFYKNVAAA